MYIGKIGAAQAFNGTRTSTRPTTREEDAKLLAEIEDKICKTPYILNARDSYDRIEKYKVECDFGQIEFKQLERGLPSFKIFPYYYDIYRYNTIFQCDETREQLFNRLLNVTIFQCDENREQFDHLLNVIRAKLNALGITGFDKIKELTGMDKKWNLPSVHGTKTTVGETSLEADNELLEDAIKILKEYNGGAVIESDGKDFEFILDPQQSENQINKIRFSNNIWSPIIEITGKNADEEYVHKINLYTENKKQAKAIAGFAGEKFLNGLLDKFKNATKFDVLYSVYSPRSSDDCR